VEAIRRIDLNADLGEGFDDEGLLAVVTSANVACGFHAGDDATMRLVCRLAADRGVAVGAQVSYRDREGFGRRFIDVDYATLRADITEQLGALAGFALESGTTMRYVKPHGALYHACSAHPVQAAAVLDALVAHDPALSLVAAAESTFGRTARDSGIHVVDEGFADRRYHADGTLVARGETGAVIDDPADAAAQAVTIVVDECAPTIDGDVIRIVVQSLCVHGDSPDAPLTARAVRNALTDAGVTIGPFA
jgi:5-oxoprolinase (ATP-hydrolysing) subunit A